MPFSFKVDLVVLEVSSLRYCEQLDHFCKAYLPHIYP
jgi:hypothetical protein